MKLTPHYLGPRSLSFETQEEAPDSDLCMATMPSPIARGVFESGPGAISWRLDTSSAQVKSSWIRAHLKATRSNNSTISCSDLNRDELRALCLTTALTAP